MFVSAFTSTSNILKDFLYFGETKSDPLVRHHLSAYENLQQTEGKNNYVTFWTAIQKGQTTAALLTGKNVLLIFLL